MLITFGVFGLKYNWFGKLVVSTCYGGVMNIGKRMDVNVLVEQYAMDIDSSIPMKHSAKYQYDILSAYFSKFDVISDAVSDENVLMSALMMNHYLATWGMFRGSSQLSNTNTYFMVDLLAFLLNSKNGVLLPLLDRDFSSFSPCDIPLLKDTLNKIRREIASSGVSPTDTLVSKILLGVWGQVPAYDRYFINGVRYINGLTNYNLTQSLSANGLVKLSIWARQFDWHPIFSNSEFGNGAEYSLAKKVDMALFALGKYS